jgi:hypothetical protein
MCGTIHEISAEDQGERLRCGTCRRRFEVQISYDLPSGRNDVAIHYLTDQNVRTGETCVIGSATEVGGPPSQEAHAAVHALQPEPKEALHKCTCGRAVGPGQPLREGSSARLRRRMVFLLFDPA